MANDEKIKKKLGKLLTKWSVPDAEKIEFLKELEEEMSKPDEEEDLEGVAEETETEQVEEESPNKEVGEEEVEEQEVSEDAEEPTETEPTEEPVEEPLPEEPVAEEQPNVEEQPGEEEPPVEEPPVEENPMDQPMEQPQPTTEGGNTLELENKVKELESTNAEMANRLKAIEEVITKLGLVVETEDDQLGLTPTSAPSVQGENDAFAAINKKRIG